MIVYVHPREISKKVNMATGYQRNYDFDKENTGHIPYEPTYSYHISRAAGAVYKIGEAKGNTILINLEVFDEYMEQFREPPTEMKHPLPNVKGD